MPLITKEAARALKAVSNELFVQGYRLKVFDAYRPACAVRSFVLWGLEDQDKRMKEYFYPDLEKDHGKTQEICLFRPGRLYR